MTQAVCQRAILRQYKVYTFMFRIIGALGLLLISAGIVVKNRKKQNYLFVVGGILLEAYSIYIGDVVFIILQIIFILAAVYDLFKLKK